MTDIIGKISDGFDGKIVVTPDFPFVDENETPSALVITPFSEDISGGVFSITVPQSENVIKNGNASTITESVTYEWKIIEVVRNTVYYLQDGTVYEGAMNFTDGNWYTGGSYSPTESRRLDKVDKEKEKEILNIHAVCPDLPTAVEFTSLVSIPAQGAWLGIGTRRIAKLLTDPNEPYLAQISSGFNFRGEYDAGEVYEVRDSVSFEGSSYVWIAANSGSEPPPSDSWQLVAEKGETGSGTAADLVGYNPQQWEGKAIAAAQGDIVEALNTIESVDTNQFITREEGALRNNGTFTGSMRRLSGVPDTDQEITTVSYVRQAISEATPNLFPQPLVLVRRLGSLRLLPEQPQKITWEGIEINDDFYWNLGTGEMILPAGLYYFSMSLRIKTYTNYPNHTRRCLIDTHLYQVSPVPGIMAHFYKIDQSGTQSDREILAQGTTILSLSGGERLNFRAGLSGRGVVGTTPDGGEIMAQQVNNFLAVWRIR